MSFLDAPKRSASFALPQQRWDVATPRRQSQALVVLGLGLGTLLEWYDYQLYAGLSGVLAPQFFPSSSSLTQSLSFWGVFAVAFVARPLGAVVFGHIADTSGRKTSLLISLLAMGLPTVIVGCLPTYQMVGVAAPILLALLRAIQGLAIGGEYGTAVVYVFELAPPGWEGRQASVIVALCNAGVLVGNLIVMLFVGVFSEAQLKLWGWRIPFLAVIITIVLAYTLRQRMPDTVELLARAKLAAEEKRECAAAEAGARHGTGSLPRHRALEEVVFEQRRRVPMGVLLSHHVVPLLLQITVTTCASATFYSYTAWLPQHIAALGVPLLISQTMLTTAQIVLICCILLAGWACDLGLPVCWAGVAVSLASAPLPFALCALAACLVGGGAGPLAGMWLLHVLVMGLTGTSVALLPTVGVNIYDPAVRATGYNLGYNLAFGLIGGLSPMAVTAISAASGAPGQFAVAWWVLTWSSVSAVGFAAMLWLYPACNRTIAMPLLIEQRRPMDPLALRELRGLSVSVTAASGCSLARGGGSTCPVARGPMGTSRTGLGVGEWQPAIKELPE